MSKYRETMKAEIREWVVNDFDASLEIFDSNVPKYFHQDERTLYSEFLRQLGSEDVRKTFYCALVHDDAVIGCGGISLTRELDKCCMTWGMVHRDFHKKGFGQQLLEHRIDLWSRLFGSYPLVLDTTQHSAPFFERNGFVVTNVICDFYAPGMDRYDMVYLVGRKNAGLD